MSTTRPIFQRLASLAQAYQNCAQSGNAWGDTHDARADLLVKEFLPSGSGWDLGTQFLIHDSHGEKLMFQGSFHHMDEHGGYDGWTDHTITVTGSLMGGVNLKISGRNRNDIKELIHQVFDTALSHQVSDDQIAGLYAAAGLASAPVRS